MKSLFCSSLFQGLFALLLCLCAARLVDADSNQPSLSEPQPVEIHPNLWRRQSRTDPEGGGLHRFEKVVTEFLSPEDELYRSSAPFYTGSDSSQKVRGSTVQALREKKITLVISLNSEAVNDDFLRLFSANKIEYRAVPVKDYGAPAKQQLEEVTDAFLAHRGKGGTLVHCGHGSGRTGTAVSAIEMRVQSTLPPDVRKLLTPDDLKANLVETPRQIDVLGEYQRRLSPVCG
ncbi:hypothetical protein XA68_14227 [Ophiocordyceps unilateralis]|uniref:Tyrosine specific protein phosphatases domain-containing protein n=1 Tax=Ophiocordyceps unilateralis TaxID=268505 RepID=A0A2A9PAW4_OPHUN|nr:hypothetical protein XA68_14227 [Ophiocordyceps unilateralis]